MEKLWSKPLPGLLGLTFIVAVSVSSCNNAKIYDRFHDLAGGTWPVDSTQQFVFQIADTAKRYDFYIQVRNSANYEFYNLYARFSLKDSLHRSLSGELQEYVLFDPESGKPYGGGLGDLFSHSFPALGAFRFPHPGIYSLHITQYMRTDPLPGIESVGLRIEAR